ncbi:hypothetical protein D9M72_379500 [compost metagenome]
MVDVVAAAGVDADGFVLQDQPHQVKEVAALLHQRASGPLREAVPGIHLVQEREAVLHDGEHVHVAEPAAVGCLNDLLHRRHVAVLHGNPHRRGVVSCQRFKLVGLFRSGAHGLLHQHGQVGATREDVLEDGQVRVVGAGDHQCIHQSGREQVLVTGEGLYLVADFRNGLRQR